MVNRNGPLHVERPKRIAVVGLGNTLRRDDGIGIVILERLIRSYKRQGVDYLDFGISSFDLLYCLKEYDVALLIDGIDASLSRAEFKIFKSNRITFRLENRVISSHELNLKDLFELCEKYKIKTTVYVAGIQVEDVSFGIGLSQALKKRQGEIAREISVFIDRILKNPKNG